MKTEYDAHVQNGMYKLMLLLAREHVIGEQWVFKLKRHANGAINKLKVQWVSKGYSQIKGINYNEAFLPIMSMGTLHLVLTVTVTCGYLVHHMDMSNTFLNVALTNQNTYVWQPQGFIDPDRPNHMCHLKKSLYSLWQAPLKWNHTIDHFFHDQGFNSSDANLCLYI